MKSLSPKILRRLLAAVSLALVCVLILQILFWAGVIGKKTAGGETTRAGIGSLSREGYTLEQAVVLSRHNI